MEAPTTSPLAPCARTRSPRPPGTDVGGASALPNVTANITISGYHTTLARASSAPGFRLVETDPGGSLSLNQITLTGGSTAFGGAFFNQGTITLNSITVTGNHSDSSGGGGYFNLGTTTFNNSTLATNTAVINGGGLRNFSGTTTLNFSSVTHNTVTGSSVGSAGGGVFLRSGSVVLQSSTVTANTPDNCDPPNSVPGCTG